MIDLGLTAIIFIHIVFQRLCSFGKSEIKYLEYLIGS